ncbi:MAG: VOC family protein [Roseivirga sp.]|nr:VOC family protein [Roseivirga sp.]
MNLNQVTIPSLNLSVSVAFYQKLGLKLIVDALPRYARFELSEGEATFSIHLVEELPAGNGIVVYFETEDLEARVKLLKAEGIQFDLDPTDQSWLWKEARLRDPDDNQLIIFYAGKNRKNPPWRVN